LTSTQSCGMVYPMKMKYTYFDTSKTKWIHPQGKQLHGHYQAPAIFECISDSILHADKLCEQAMKDGKIKFEKPPKSLDLNKINFISCGVKPLKWWEIFLDFIHLI
jgi:hypothetical protein